MDFYVGMIFGAVIMACVETKSVRDGFRSLFAELWSRIKEMLNK